MLQPPPHPTCITFGTVCRCRGVGGVVICTRPGGGGRKGCHGGTGEANYENEGANAHRRRRPQNGRAVNAQKRKSVAPGPRIAASSRRRKPTIVPPRVRNPGITVRRNCLEPQRSFRRRSLRRWGELRLFGCCWCGRSLMDRHSGGSGGAHVAPVKNVGGIPAILTEVEVAAWPRRPIARAAEARSRASVAPPLVGCGRGRGE